MSVEIEPVAVQDPVIPEMEENNEGCLSKTTAMLISFGHVLNQVFWNSLGDFFHDETYMYADQRLARLKEKMKYSAEPISQTPFFLDKFLQITSDGTMNEYDLDRAFFDVYNRIHPRLQKALHYVIWKQAKMPEIDPDVFGRDQIEAHPRSDSVRIAIRHICSYAEFHREYLPHRFVLYTDDVVLDKIVLEGIYNIQLNMVEG